MARVITVGAAQMGAIQRSEGRQAVLPRMIDLLERAHRHGCTLVVFPELALTTFFPRWYTEDIAEVDAWFEPTMPNPAVQPLFDKAKQLGIGFYLGYAELDHEAGKLHRYNTSILVDTAGRIVGKYRKIHLPGHAEFDAKRRWQHLEKRYFEVGNLGWPVWRSMGGVMGMCICNDRRWPETYRVMGLQGVEMVMCGYNTPIGNSQSTAESPHTRMFHNHLCLQSGAYQNSTWVVGVAKAGNEDSHELMGGSVIVAPSGEIAAQALTMNDELVVADCDLDMARFGKETIFNFAAHRRPEHYRIIVEQTGATAPPD